MSETGGKRPDFPKLTVLVGSNELPVRTWARFIRFHDRVGRRLEQIFAKRGVSSAQFDVLMTLQFGEGITQQELARRLLVTKGNVCGLIDRMESAGWVERRADPEDRRANRLYLTEEGRKRAAETLPDHHSLVEETLGRLDEREIRTLYELMDKLDPEV
jgi:DNA-binding MarR family transcriptional regulator